MTLISKYLKGVVVKRLAKGELPKDTTKKQTSTQHEFNSTRKMKELFGSEDISFPASRIIYFSDIELAEELCNFKWYDARREHPIRSEFRLYYAAKEVIYKAEADDLLIIAKTVTDDLVAVIAQKDSTAEQQLLWLFNFGEIGNTFETLNFSEDHIELGFAGRHILSLFGIEAEDTSDKFLDLIFGRFGTEFPSTRIFSAFARETFQKGELSALEDPDTALVKWFEREELLFKTLEKYKISEKLKKGFGADGTDVEDFLSFSKSVMQVRKSRAGFAFENHLEELFLQHKIQYARGQKTENDNKPDFVFPGIDQYRNKDFAAELLTMLGAKTTAKDRWRQILPEADRIWPKHLITLEPAISRNQTDEMTAQKVQLVIPTEIVSTYHTDQQKVIMPVYAFLHELKEKQSNPGNNQFKTFSLF